MTDDVVAELLDAIPETMRTKSGTALYSGLDAWTGSCPIYLLGYNPGGEPGPDTIYGNAENLLYDLPANYSAYRDERWNPGGRWHAVGQAPMQQRVRYLLDRLALDPGEVPTSNVIYARSRRVAHMAREQADGWAEECWPFHDRMIERLAVKVVVCLGGGTAWFVRSKLQAHTETERFVENNERRWISRTFTGPGPTVVQLTHPGVANWKNPDTDPTGLVLRALAAHDGAEIAAPPRNIPVREAGQRVAPSESIAPARTVLPDIGDTYASDRPGVGDYVVARIRMGWKFATLYDADGVQQNRLPLTDG